jgi:hypothetical protein
MNHEGAKRHRQGKVPSDSQESQVQAGTAGLGLHLEAWSGRHAKIHVDKKLSSVVWLDCAKPIET